ncbi:hypothetical protein K5X82_13925 [Halosquirtibacter xylanolyticus]|uniref:hypothetical protein n=1 Tax=Halosquirtibacter xylanolyticus TaxID=3374599 RepID=UPI00374968CE|nr:hypothetical protein K5X82_13925 [Prolixibacteraceae bacterium]
MMDLSKVFLLVNLLIVILVVFLKGLKPPHEIVYTSCKMDGGFISSLYHDKSIIT